jgi:hypothetical protein
VINGAPGSGIGETRSEGLRLMKAISKIANPRAIDAIEKILKLKLAISRAPLGFTAKRANKPN